MSKTKSYSLNTKITLSFIALGFTLLGILFIQIIPNLQSEQNRYKKNQIEHTIFLTNQQIKLGVELLIHSSESRVKDIEAQLKDILNKYNLDNIDFESIKNKTQCEAYFFSKKEEFLSSIINKSGLSIYYGNQNHMCPKMTQKVFYVKELSNNKKLVLECNPKNFENKHINLEENIKKDLEKSFDLTHRDHKGKLNLIWINTKHETYSSHPLYNSDDSTYNTKYCLSKMSSTNIPQTGELTGKQIVESSDKSPISHGLVINENSQDIHKKSLTWVRTIADMGNRKLLFLTTVYEEDLNRDLYEPIFNIFPASIFALSIAIILGFFIFKRLFKSINILTNTAKEVNKGNMNLRSGIKGSDDIAILAHAFDSMLDSIEENIKVLDKKVDDKTELLSNSLEEKEVLLKEIHHRVKNNLAMTINLIKLQKSKIDDKKTKDVLVDVQERIYTMELLHRKLYESKDLSSISFKKYVADLSEDIGKTYSGSKDIRVISHIEDINMNIEYALPCGLIITECLTNAYKYAFNNTNTGTINILFTIKDKRCSLIISDDGVGLANHIDINKSKTLGLKLISSIVKGQLLGTFDYIYKNGAKFYIVFRIE